MITPTHHELLTNLLSDLNLVLNDASLPSSLHDWLEVAIARASVEAVSDVPRIDLDKLVACGYVVTIGRPAPATSQSDVSKSIAKIWRGRSEPTPEPERDEEYGR